MTGSSHKGGFGSARRNGTTALDRARSDRRSSFSSAKDVDNSLKLVDRQPRLRMCRQNSRGEKSLSSPQSAAPMPVTFPLHLLCSFSSLLSVRDALNCTETGRLTGCPARAASPSCPIFPPPHLTVVGFCAVLDRTRWHGSQFRHGDDDQIPSGGSFRAVPPASRPPSDPQLWMTTRSAPPRWPRVAATEPSWTGGARAEISRPQGVEQDVVKSRNMDAGHGAPEATG